MVFWISITTTYLIGIYSFIPIKSTNICITTSERGIRNVTMPINQLSIRLSYVLKNYLFSNYMKIYYYKNLWNFNFY